METDWKDRWLRRPHPVLVAAFLIGSLLMMYDGYAPKGPVLDNESLGTLVAGEVIKVISEEEVPATAGARTTLVQELVVRISEPDNSERDVTVTNDLTPLEAGDDVWTTVTGLGTDQEAIHMLDIQRTGGLAWLFAAFVGLVLLISGRKGAYALVGLVFTLAIILVVVVPAILNGHDPVVVGLVASAVILVGTIYVSYGFDGKSLSALAGIVVTLLLVGYLGQWVVGSLHFTGYSGEHSLYLNYETDNAINLVDLVIAGIIIAAIGVLDDVAVTQSSTVYELAKASPARGWRLFRHAMEVGKDHISGVINTLVLAYAGASLPLILLLYLSRFPLDFTLGGELIAEEIVRTLVSSMGLVLAVPLTTLIATLVVSRGRMTG